MQGLVPERVATLAIDFSYLLVAFLFIMGLKAMSSPVTARRPPRGGRQARLGGHAGARRARLWRGRAAWR